MKDRLHRAWIKGLIEGIHMERERIKNEVYKLELQNEKLLLLNVIDDDQPLLLINQ